ncbi:MAG: SDR family NAD(P)-dependent oxidoreductase [Bacteroidetes bacterium]|nr:MAG: SDR family NAD(P)-dependent oxidoreductase [Bacteroidota bacterium]MBL1144004.1 SDR family NAD(P)-dependent oxidoreductase [Bacteroidota bacterium]MCB0803468.1 SDR family NAD(P)-dependent oxidoreductase [Flavobacteriales bacterium]NOG56805.1 SDR family NAD(P)-dependent oxidoreductase [Bacteroidota bacterium]
MEKRIMITGATAGIGEATARLYAEHGYHLILTGRRDNLLQTLKNKLENQFGIKIKTLNFDVKDKEAVKKAIASLKDEWREIDVLINNAGLAKGFHDIQDGLIEDWESMIDTNIKGLLYVSREIMPIMIENRKGHIVNIGSIAGKEVYSKGNVYCSTKHAVEGITKAMRMDLLPHKIKVTAICPGAVDTEFSKVRFDGNQARADQVYDGYQPLKAIDIAEAIYFATSRPAHVNINDLLIMPTAQADTSHLLRE